MEVGNLISGSSAFSKPSLNIWKFSVHVLLKPRLENFQHYFESMWNACNCAVVWTFFGIALWDWNENWLFPVLWPLWVFQICWHIECSTLTASSLSIWNSSAGIPSLPLALFVMMFLRPTWLNTPRCLALGEWSHYHGYLGHKYLFLYCFFCVFLPPSLNIFCFCPYHFCPLLCPSCMKYSLGISDFLEGISSLSHSIVFLYFFALITEEGFLIPPCYSLKLCIQSGISFLFSFAFSFSSLSSVYL